VAPLEGYPGVPAPGVVPDAVAAAIAKEYEWLGYAPDEDIAAVAGVSPADVKGYRRAAGIPERKPSSLPDFDSRIGVEPDSVIAEEAGVSVSAVRAYRDTNGIPPAPTPVVAEGASLEEAIGAAAEQIGVAPSMLRYTKKAKKGKVTVSAWVQPQAPRRRPGAMARRKAPTPGLLGSLLPSIHDRIGSAPDLEIANAVGVTEAEVRLYREQKGIPAFEEYGARPEFGIMASSGELPLAKPAAPAATAAPAAPAAAAKPPEPPKKVGDLLPEDMVEKAISVLKSGGTPLAPYEEAAIAKIRLFAGDQRAISDLTDAEYEALRDAMGYFFDGLMRKQQMAEEMGEKVIRLFGGREADMFLDKGKRNPLRTEQIVMAYRLFIDPLDGDWQNLFNYLGDGTAKVPSRAWSNDKAGMQAMADAMGMELEDVPADLGVDFDSLPDVEAATGPKPLVDVRGLDIRNRDKRGSPLDPNLAYAQILIRMRLEDVASKMTEKLARIGIEADMRKVVGGGDAAGRTGKMKPRVTELHDKEAQIKRVARYLDEIITSRDSSDVVLPATPDMDPRDAKALEFKNAPKANFAGRILGRHDMEAYTLATKIAASWGVTPSSGKLTSFHECNFGGKRLHIPDVVESEINRAVSDISNMTDDPLAFVEHGEHLTENQSKIRTAVEWLIDHNPFTVSHIKVGLTTGILIPNPAYFVGNFIGNIFLAWSGVGLKPAIRMGAGGVFAMPTALAAMVPSEVVRSASGLPGVQSVAGAAKKVSSAMPSISGTFGDSHEMATAMMGRLWGHGDYKPSAKPIITKDGRIYSADDIEQMARSAGLRSSFIQAETARAIAKDLRNSEASAWAKLRHWREFGAAGTGKVIAKGATLDAAKWWQSTLTETATGIDNYFRANIFIDSLRAGKSPAEAAELARTVLFDYSSLTDFEKKTMRKIILFYSFQRKNMDLFYFTIARNPSRVMGQVRLVRDLHQEFIEGDPEVMLKDWEKSRMPVYAREAAVETGKQQVIYLAPPIPVMDNVNLMLSILTLDFGAIGERAATSVNPGVQFLAEAILDKDLHTQTQLGAYEDVPNFFMDLDGSFGGFFRRTMDIQPDDIPDPLYAEIVGERVYRPKSRKGRILWHMWSNLLQVPGAGRSIDTLQAMDRANLGPIELANRAAYQAYLLKEEMGLTGYTPPSEMPTGEDTAGPRSGLTEADETLNLFGVKARYVPRPQQVNAIRDRDRARVLNDATKDITTKSEAKIRYMDDRFVPTP
jgi:hypothetical protein